MADQPASGTERDRAIGEWAYAIWPEKERPEGKELEHWRRAEQERNHEVGPALLPKQAAGRSRAAALRHARNGARPRARAGRA